MARTRMRRKRDAHTCTPTYHHHGPNRWEEGQREEEGRPGGSLDGCPGRLLCGLCSVLHDEFRHGLDRWVIEDQCHGQIDSWQLLGERIAQEHRSVAGEAALHERGIKLDLLVVADQALGHLKDLALEHIRIQARADVELCELRFVTAACRSARRCLLVGLLRDGRQTLALRHHRGSLLHLPLLLLLLLALADLRLDLLDALQLVPALVLALYVADLLEEVDTFFRQLPCPAELLVVAVDVGKQDEGRSLTLGGARGAEDAQGLLGRL
mmetsp:Transcript_69100/g.205624  ORF Transcript_69100/g.205624 Transcript_69100/m.205624 type:complete len:268 (-) Transcript_69100:1896-2699(-)